MRTPNEGETDDEERALARGGENTVIVHGKKKSKLVDVLVSIYRDLF